MKNISVVILAAGKGTRLNSSDKNKVVLPIGGKPMILYEIELLEELHISPIIIVVGFAKKSILDILGTRAEYVEQNDQLGTAHALETALPAIPETSKNVLVIQGDDSLLFTQSRMKDVLQEMINLHNLENADITLLTYKTDTPKDFGRIVRGKDGNIQKIVEEKDATLDEQKIQEVNTGCYVFSLDFLNENIHKLRKSSVTSEYYVTDLVGVAVEYNKKVLSRELLEFVWQSVNTPSEFEKANKLFLQIK